MMLHRCLVLVALSLSGASALLEQIRCANSYGHVAHSFFLICVNACTSDPRCERWTWHPEHSDTIGHCWHYDGSSHGCGANTQSGKYFSGLSPHVRGTVVTTGRCVGHYAELPGQATDEQCRFWCFNDVNCVRFIHHGGTCYYFRQDAVCIDEPGWSYEVFTERVASPCRLKVNKAYKLISRRGAKNVRYPGAEGHVMRGYETPTAGVYEMILGVYLLVTAKDGPDAGKTVGPAQDHAAGRSHYLTHYQIKGASDGFCTVTSADGNMAWNMDSGMNWNMAPINGDISQQWLFEPINAPECVAERIEITGALPARRVGSTVIGAGVGASCSTGTVRLPLSVTKTVTESNTLGKSNTQEVNWSRTLTVGTSTSVGVSKVFTASVSVDVSRSNTKGGSKSWTNSRSRTVGNSVSTSVGYTAPFEGPGAAFAWGIVDEYLVDAQNVPVVYEYKCPHNPLRFRQAGLMNFETKTYGVAKYRHEAFRYNGGECSAERVRCPHDIEYNNIIDVRQKLDEFEQCFAGGVGVRQ